MERQPAASVSGGDSRSVSSIGSRSFAAVSVSLRRLIHPAKDYGNTVAVLAKIGDGSEQCLQHSVQRTARVLHPVRQCIQKADCHRALFAECRIL